MAWSGKWYAIYEVLDEDKEGGPSHWKVGHSFKDINEAREYLQEHDGRGTYEIREVDATHIVERWSLTFNMEELVP